MTCRDPNCPGPSGGACSSLRQLENIFIDSILSSVFHRKGITTKERTMERKGRWKARPFEERRGEERWFAGSSMTNVVYEGRRAHLHPCQRRCTDKRGGCRACARRRPPVAGPRPPRPNRRRHVPRSVHEARCAAAAAGYRTVGRPSSTRPATAPNLGTKSHGKSRYTRPLPRLSPDDAPR